MEKCENFTNEEWAALSPEEQEQALRVEDAIEQFLADSRAMRYVESEFNKDALLNFLEDHNLEITHANLLFAYSALCAEGTMELVPLATQVAPTDSPPASTRPPAPILTAPDPRAPRMFRNGQPISYTPARVL